MKIIVVYDSATGNTEKMAKAIAEGARAGGAAVEIKKVGEPFPLKSLENADGALFGSPCIYANVTMAMQGFLENMNAAIKSGKLNLKNKKAAVFGSYGWDGAWVMEQKFKDYVSGLGYKIEKEACVEVGDDLKFHPDDHLSKCRNWGKQFAESL